MNPYLFSILHSFFGAGFLYKYFVAPLGVYTLWGTHHLELYPEKCELYPIENMHQEPLVYTLCVCQSRDKIDE